MVLLAKKTVLLAAIESTPGVAETLSEATDGDFNVYNVKVANNTEFTPRQGQAAFTPIQGVTGARKGQITFSTDLVGSGESGSPVPAWASTFLPACRLAQGTPNVFTPYSEAPGDNVKTLTIAHYADGKRWLLRGCMGNAVFNMSAGRTGMVDFTFDGILDEPTDEALVVPDFPETLPPRFANNVVNLAGTATAQAVSDIKLDLGNTIALREDPADESGYGYAIISEGVVKGTMAPEAHLQSVYNADSIFLTGTTQPLSFSVGQTAGNIIAFSMPAVQFTKLNPGERNGVQTNDLEFQAVRSADAGDDELSITFS